MDALDHRSLPYCTSCDRYFQKPLDLYQHMNSPIHIRADPIHIAPVPPVRLAPVPRPAPVDTPAPLVATPSSSVPATDLHRAPRLDPVVNTTLARPIPATPPVTATPAAIATQTASGRLSDSQLAKPCTTCIPFKAYIESDNSSSAVLHCQSITFMRPHQAFSFEEYRLSDYRAGCTPAISSIQVVVRPIYRDQATQADIPRPPPSSVYVSAASSRATTPIDPTQEHSTALTADEVAGFHLIHEARCDARKLLMDGDNKLEWIKHGADLIRILQCKTTALLHILMLADKSGKIGMNFNVSLDATLYTVRKARIVQLNVPGKEDEVDSHFCIFEDEANAKQFLDTLLEVIAKTRASTSDSPNFSLSEIKSQQIEPVMRLSILSCPFCRSSFNAVWEVSEHLETSSCQQRWNLNRGSIHRHYRQHDPNGIITLQPSGSKTGPYLYRYPNEVECCKTKFMTSFTELLVHLESESCGFVKREDLWKDISECGNLWKGIGDC
jgi:hypothetical protein